MLEVPITMKVVPLLLAGWMMVSGTITQFATNLYDMEITSYLNGTRIIRDKTIPDTEMIILISPDKEILDISINKDFPNEQTDQRARFWTKLIQETDNEVIIGMVNEMRKKRTNSIDDTVNIHAR